MSGCLGGCPREQQQQDNVSLGIIADNEVISRGGFYSSGVDKKGKIRPSLIRKSDLKIGQCSVWRMSPPGLTPDVLIPLLKASRADPLLVLASTTAQKIREVTLVSGGRAFCVVDECDCDQEGGKHPAHAHIALCGVAVAATPELANLDPLADTEDFIQAHRDLVLLFKAGPTLWQEPLAEAA